MKYPTVKTNLDNHPHLGPRDRTAVRAATTLFDLTQEELNDLVALLRAQEDEAAMKLSIAQTNLERAKKARIAVEHLING